jgi:WD40 repeat protein/DNA-binding SARP family transcriptional activator
MKIEVLGPLTVDGRTSAIGPRDRVVLAALATRPGGTVTYEQLGDALWGEQPPASWLKVVQGCVARLRRTLGRDAIETVGSGYRLAVPRDEVDSARFERVVAKAQELLALDEPHRAVFVTDSAFALWRGPPLQEVESWPPGRIEAERLEELRRDAEELRLEALLRAGRCRDALAEARARVAEAPLRERRWGLLALAQYQAGRQGEALATLRRARDSLADGLGLDPGAELVRLEERILRHDPALATGDELPAASPVCPYPGLLPYGVEDADWFFGRQRDVAACLERVTAVGVLAVVGPSGSGKSSLLRAGVVAALRRDGHHVDVITPGVRPMDALSGVRSSGSAAVLVVDQCEEALTLCADDAERARFLAALTEHAAHAPLLIALRADRLGDLAAHPEFASLVERGLHLLTRMTDEDLRDAIEGPARQAGLLLEAGLVDLLVRDVEGEPGALPLLSHALRQTWLAREGRTLTVVGYHASGGIRGAVAQTAEEVYEHAAPEQRALVRDLLLRLVAPSPEGAPVRSRVHRRMLATDATHEQVVELLVAARLVTCDEDVIELAHEALTRAWPRLRTWLDDNVEGQRILRHLTTTADTWEAMGRPDSELYRGVRLSRALEWRRKATPDLHPTERDFLDASAARARAEQRAARHRRRTLVGVLAGATIVASALAVTAVLQARHTSAQRDIALAAEGRAEAATLDGRSRELAASAIAVLEDDPELSLLLALEAARDGDLPLQTTRALRRAILDNRTILTVEWADTELVSSRTGGVFDGTMSPDGTLLAVGGGASVFAMRSLELWDVDGRERLWSTGDLGVELGRPVFTADGTRLLAPGYVPVAGGADAGGGHRPATPEEGAAGVGAAGVGAAGEGAADGVYVWEVATGRAELLGLPLACPVTGIVTGPAVDLDQPLVVAADGALTGCRDGVTLAVVDLPAGTSSTLAEVDLLGGATTSHDGAVLAVAERHRMWVADTTTGEVLFDVGICCGAVSLSPQGDHLLTASAEGPALLWELESGEVAREVSELGQLTGEEHTVFDTAGTSLISGGRHGVLHLFDEGTGRNRTLRGHDGEVLSVSVAADTSRVASFSTDGTARVWDLDERGEVEAIDVGAEGWYPADGLTVAGEVGAVYDLTEQGGRYLVFDTVTGEVTTTIEPIDPQRGILSHEGRLLAAPQLVDDTLWGPVRLHDLERGDATVELQNPCERGVYDGNAACAGEGFFPLGTWQLEFSPDGSLLAMGGMEAGGATALVWSTETGDIVFDAGVLITGVLPIAFAPDGDSLAVSLGDALVVHDTADWTERARVEIAGAPLRALRATPDGRLLVGATEASNIVIFDATTLAQDGAAFNGNDGRVTDLEVSPDGTLLVVAGDDGLARVWDLATRRQLDAIPAGDGSALQNVAFRDGSHLLVTRRTGPLLVFTLDTDELLTIARDRLTRGLSGEECTTYRFDPCPSLADSRRP